MAFSFCFMARAVGAAGTARDESMQRAAPSAPLASCLDNDIALTWIEIDTHQEEYQEMGMTARDQHADLGILGGGQLARMLTEAALPLGREVAIWENSADSPAGRLTPHEIVGRWDDQAARQRFSQLVPRVTLENEFIPLHLLHQLAEAGLDLTPHPTAMALVQDKLLQKERLAAAGLPLPPFRGVETPAEVIAAGAEFGWPLVLKRRRNGYDGYGNRTLHTPAEVEEAMVALHGPEERPAEERALFVEGYISFSHELAVMVARSHSGETRLYPVVQTIQRQHICHQVLAPAPVDPVLSEEAAAIARAAVTAFDLHGLVGVELFVSSEGKVLVNELAPRVHNSGHYTIEGCVTSQFEQAIRIAMDWPLGETVMRAPAAVMINLLGVPQPPARPTGVAEVLALPGVHLHLYGKRQSRAGRKMGHLTVLGETLERAQSLASHAATLLTI